jgi:ribosomal protein L20A (L18A)
MIYKYSELISDGWKVVGSLAPEEMTELTLDEIAAKFGLSVDKIRIKKEE